MARFKVAHLRQQGQNMIVVPLDSQFGYKSSADQQEIISELQIRSRAAGMAGTVVPVWDGGGGRMSYIAPRPWHPFFSSMNLRSVHANINKELSW